MILDTKLQRERPEAFRAWDSDLHIGSSVDQDFTDLEMTRSGGQDQGGAAVRITDLQGSRLGAQDLGTGLETYPQRRLKHLKSKS